MDHRPPLEYGYEHQRKLRFEFSLRRSTLCSDRPGYDVADDGWDGRFYGSLP